MSKMSSVHDEIFKIAKSTRRSLDISFHLDNQPEVTHTYDRDIAFHVNEELLKNGFHSSCVCGYYLDCDPDTYEYTEEESHSTDSTARKHWWNVVENDLIVDISADQFYKECRRKQHEVIVTSISDRRYSKPRT